MKRTAACIAVASVAFSICAADAGAVENQHHIGLDPQLALLKIDDKSTLDVGAGLGVHWTYGLNDQINLMAEGSAAIVAAKQKQDEPSSPHTRPAEVDHLAFGIGYVIDVIRWVPYLAALGSAYRLSGGTIDNQLLVFGVELGAGLDYQLSRSWAVGVGIRQHMLLTKMSTYPSYTTGLLRLEYMWGF
ncbi:MAG TPA: outer membrane beta-barrel protein [Labilithrix sp.]|jgi:opacity protein-like surface antigen